MSTVLKLGIVVFAVAVLMTPSVAFAAEGEATSLIYLGGAFGAGLVILGAGMGGDRFSVIFSSLADLDHLVTESCEAR